RGPVYSAGLFGRLGEGARDPRPPPVANLPLFLELAGILALAPILFPPVDDHRDVRVVLVVLDHLVVELVGELWGDHAIDHVSDCTRALSGRHPPYPKRRPSP